MKYEIGLIPWRPLSYTFPLECDDIALYRPTMACKAMPSVDQFKECTVWLDTFITKTMRSRQDLEPWQPFEYVLPLEHETPVKAHMPLIKQFIINTVLLDSALEEIMCS